MKTKIIYHVNAEICGEQDFFFDEKGKLLHWWDRNDADYRKEYMNPLFDALHISVVEAKWDEPLWKDIVKSIIIDCGASEADFE